MSNIRLYHPQILPFEQIKYLCDYKAKEKIDPERIIIFLNYLHRLNGAFCRRQNIEHTYKYFLPVSSDILKKIFGQHEAAYAVKFLVENDIIEHTDYSFSKDRLTGEVRRFRLHPSLLQASQKQTKHLLSSKKAINAYVKFIAYREEEYIKKIYGIRNQLAYIAKNSIVLDLNNPAAKYLLKKKRLRNFGQPIRYRHLEAMQAINERLATYYTQDRYGRFYTHWVGLTKTCHQFVRFTDLKHNNEQVADIDVANGHLIFFHSLIILSYRISYLLTVMI